MFDVRLFHLPHLTIELKSSPFKTLQFDVKSRLIDLFVFAQQMRSHVLLNVLFESF